ncbi:hypothetical protein HDV57DRAFT_518118 [Trichoderma longibrachiatum]
MAQVEARTITKSLSHFTITTQKLHIILMKFTNVDSDRSATWYDRHWGEDTPSRGRRRIPIQLENGVRI